MIFLTRHNVPKPDGRHGDEAEVESVEEAPVLPYSEDAASDAEEQRQVGQGQEGRQGVAAKTAVVIVVVFFGSAVCRIKQSSKVKSLQCLNLIRKPMDSFVNTPLFYSCRKKHKIKYHVIQPIQSFLPQISNMASILDLTALQAGAFFLARPPKGVLCETRQDLPRPRLD